MWLVVQLKDALSELPTEQPYVFLSSSLFTPTAANLTPRIPTQWAYKKLTAPKLSFEEAINTTRMGLSVDEGTGDSEVVVGMKKVADPDLDVWRAYGNILPAWELLEDQVLELCREK